MRSALQSGAKITFWVASFIAAVAMSVGGMIALYTAMPALGFVVNIALIWLGISGCIWAKENP